MGARYHKSEVAVIKSKYAIETEEAIMALLPRRNWTAICRYARFKLGLHRSRRAIGLAVVEGLAKAKREKEEK